MKTFNLFSKVRIYGGLFLLLFIISCFSIEQKNNLKSDPLSYKCNLDSIKSYSKSDSLVSVIHSKIIPADYFYNPHLWFIQDAKGHINDAEIAFNYFYDKIICISISDNYAMDCDTFVKFCYSNLQKNSTNCRLLSKEKRMVNKHEILYLTLSASRHNQDLIYSFYLCCDKFGTIQYMICTTDKIYYKRKSVIEDMLNGLVIKEK